jgi:hypothetical protein
MISFNLTISTIIFSIVLNVMGFSHPEVRIRQRLLPTSLNYRMDEYFQNSILNDIVIDRSAFLPNLRVDCIKPTTKTPSHPSSLDLPRKNTNGSSSNFDGLLSVEIFCGRIFMTSIAVLFFIEILTGRSFIDALPIILR